MDELSNEFDPPIKLAIITAPENVRHAPALPL